jgi:hypothetical protein
MVEIIEGLSFEDAGGKKKFPNLESGVELSAEDFGGEELVIGLVNKKLTRLAEKMGYTHVFVPEYVLEKLKDYPEALNAYTCKATGTGYKSRKEKAQFRLSKRGIRILE